MATVTPRPTILKDFYKKSDDRNDHEGYADFFTPDATLVMGLKTFKGREATWAAVASRHHLVTDTYPKSENDLMLMGTVEYGLKNERSLKCEWAGRMYFTDEGKISFYQVYLDSSPLLVAQGKTIRGDDNGDIQIE